MSEYEDQIQECIRIVKRERKASISLFQRRLRIGFVRAAKIMDELERRGVVGPHKESEPREVLVPLEQ